MLVYIFVFSFRHFIPASNFKAIGRLIMDNISKNLGYRKLGDYLVIDKIFIFLLLILHPCIKFENTRTLTHGYTAFQTASI